MPHEIPKRITFADMDELVMGDEAQVLPRKTFDKTSRYEHTRRSSVECRETDRHASRNVNKTGFGDRKTGSFSCESFRECCWRSASDASQDAQAIADAIEAYDDGYDRYNNGGDDDLRFNSVQRHEQMIREVRDTERTESAGDQRKRKEKNDEAEPQPSPLAQIHVCRRRFRSNRRAVSRASSSCAIAATKP